MKRVFLLFITLSFLFSCNTSNKVLIILPFEKDLFPEGIAIDPNSKSIFLNSLKKNKIVQANLDGSNSTSFIKSNQYGYLPGFGMTIKGDTLYALGNSLSKSNNRSILLLLDLNTGERIDSYSLNDSTFIYLNDLAISSKNNIYITDSESNRIYKVSSSKEELEVYLETDELAHSNGISISDDDRFLYLATYEKGIRIVDLNSKEILPEFKIDGNGIDGLKFYNNSLIGLVNGKANPNERGIYRFRLNNQKDSIIKKEKLVSFGNDFKTPTTFDIFNDCIYFIKNTQLGNFSEETGQAIDSEILESYVLMKKKIE